MSLFKKMSVGKKIYLSLGIIGVIIIIMCLMNLSALNNISILNNDVTNHLKEYKQAYETDSAENITAVEDKFAVTMKRMYLRINGTYTFNIALIVFAAIIIVINCITMKKIVINPIREASEKINEIASGNLTVRFDEYIPDNAKDEILIMKKSMNNMGEQLNKIVCDVIDTSNTVSNSMECLNNDSEVIVNATHEIVNGITEVSGGAVNQAEDTQSATLLVSTMGDNISNILNNTSDLLESANKMDNAKDTAFVSIKNLENINGQIVNNITNTNNQVEITSKSVEDMRKSIDIIKGIASQTKLLSLNSSIEAARAGEQGKGFAVVASEIRNLAEQSAKSTEEIESSLNDLLSNYDLIVENMNNTTINISEQNKTLTETKNIFVSLENGIQNTLDKISSIEEMVKVLDTYRSEVTDVISNLSALSEENAASSEQITASTQELTSTITQINENVASVRAQAEELATKVKVFII